MALTRLELALLLIVGLIVFAVSLLLSWALFRFVIVNDIEGLEFTIKQMNGKSVFDFSRNHKFILKRSHDLDQVIREIANSMNNEMLEYKRMANFRKDFIANISHELKTPIFSAQGFVHTLLDGAVKDKSVRNRFLKKAAKSLDGLDMLVQDLLTLSQIEIGDIRMHFEYFDLHKMSQDIIEQMEDAAENKNVDIKLEPEKGQMIVYADHKRIHQVMSNLIQNAIKYNKEGGWIKVVLSKGDKLQVEVSDSGEGIEEEHLGRIFERFYRVDQSRTRSKGGTGLGLSIVKHILEGHNSEVNVRSSIGDGTTFTFQLPLDRQ